MIKKFQLRPAQLFKNSADGSESVQNDLYLGKVELTL